MTRKEWVKEYRPSFVDDKYQGGVLGCPAIYEEMETNPNTLPHRDSCKGGCEECWDEELADKGGLTNVNY